MYNFPFQPNNPGPIYPISEPTLNRHTFQPIFTTAIPKETPTLLLLPSKRDQKIAKSRNFSKPSTSSRLPESYSGGEVVPSSFLSHLAASKKLSDGLMGLLVLAIWGRILN
ncbi:hypothetical protein KY290_011494 [Solanum tuberosum]|uniref:Uncharacterized protein n=1 Tax=Solanum tuberosum TaxID=4113 RepID=A0ABQ7W0U5_SOLTU|nr:hypothetical protein KY290_011494 [Solanum tuberosum]